MSNFRTKLLGLATVATAFVGVSYGQQLTCVLGNGGTAVTNFSQPNPALRAEGQTELVSTYQFSCTNPAVATATVTGATVYITLSAPVTSKNVGLVNESTLIINTGTTTVSAAGQITAAGTPAAPAPTNVYSGTVTGNQVVFTIPNGSAATPGPINIVPGATQTFEVVNVRVNASSASNPQITESGLFSYTNTTPGQGITTANAAIPAGAGPGFVLTSLGQSVTGVAAAYTVCAGNPLGAGGALPGTTSFTVNIKELVGGAFLGVGSTATTLPGTEQGQYSLASGIGAGNADIINLTLANLPAAATIYVPSTVTVTTGGPAPAAIQTTTLTAGGGTASATATFGAIAANVYTVPSGGTLVIPFTVSTTGGGALGAQTYPVPVDVVFAANSATAQGPATAAISYSPTAAALTGPATTVPTFLPSNFTGNGTSIINCQTTLLFPFVTNQVGFDTGIAISNTSVDNLGTGGKTSVAAQAGICQLFFYGTTAPTPATTPDPGGNLTSGNTHTFLLSGVAAGYQGYMIAVCPFQYAHGYAFLQTGSGTSAVAQGYLAVVLGSRAGGTSTSYGDAVTTF